MELEKMSRQERNTGIIQFPTNLHVVPRQRRLTTPGVTNLGLTLKRERRKRGKRREKEKNGGKEGRGGEEKKRCRDVEREKKRCRDDEREKKR